MDRIRLDLMRSIEMNNYGAFNRIINRINKIDFKDKQGMTPLHVAVELDRKKFVSVLINLGINVDLRDKNRNTPLLQAIKDIKKSDKARESVIIDLLKNKANVNYKKSKGSYSILHLGLMNQNDVVVKLLLEFGADPNDQNNSMGFCPLVFAFSINSTSELIKNGADPTLEDKKGNSPIIHHIINIKEGVALEMIRIQLEAAEFNMDQIIRIIHHSMDENKVKIAVYLVEEFKDKNGFEAINFIQDAVAYNQSKLLRLLLNLTNDISPINSKKPSVNPLFQAVRNKKYGTTKLLLDHGFQIPHGKDNYGKTIFDYASGTKIIKLLE